MLGSVAFMASALASFVLPKTDAMIDIPLANAATFLGAVCFLVGGATAACLADLSAVEVAQRASRGGSLQLSAISQKQEAESSLRRESIPLRSVVRSLSKLAEEIVHSERCALPCRGVCYEWY